MLIAVIPSLLLYVGIGKKNKTTYFVMKHLGSGWEISADMSYFEKVAIKLYSTCFCLSV